ncbi:cytochrome P450 [Cladochytrium replicatum]|nr:cytochrome P450 [Cladochytrium replicatum]
MLATLLILIGLIAACVATLTFKSRSFRRFIMKNFASTKYLPHPTLPGPPVLPLLGGFLSVLDSVETGEVHHDTLDRLVRYSKGGTLLVQTSVFGRTTIATGEADLAKIILAKGVRNDRIQKTGLELMKNGLFMMPTDDIWRTHRKGIQPGFGPSHLRHTFNVTNEVSRTLVEGINAKLVAANAEGRPLVLDMHELLSCLTLDVLAQVAFSADFGTLTHMLDHGETSPAFKYLGEIFTIISKRSVIPRVMWKLFGITESDTVEVRKHVHAYVHRLLSERIAKSEGTTGTTTSGDLDVMDRLLAKDENGKSRFSEAEIVDELVAFMLAGQDTTANTMTWFLLEYSRNPEYAEGLAVEADAYFAELCADDKVMLSETVFENLLSRSPKLDMFFKEVQRFHPVVTGVMRQIQDESITLDGHVIYPKESTVFVASIRGLHFNEKNWKDPYKFDPGRWIAPPVPGSFLPFADGPHNCIGRRMAVIEAMTVLAILVRHFRFKLIPGQHLRGKTAVTTGPRNGLKFEIESRV